LELLAYYWEYHPPRKHGFLLRAIWCGIFSALRGCGSRRHLRLSLAFGGSMEAAARIILGSESGNIPQTADFI
jgi:hypothetical protein